jgi:hypothetical protein
MQLNTLMAKIKIHSGPKSLSQLTSSQNVANPSPSLHPHHLLLPARFAVAIGPVLGVFSYRGCDWLSLYQEVAGGQLRHHREVPGFPKVIGRITLDWTYMRFEGLRGTPVIRLSLKSG